MEQGTGRGRFGDLRYFLKDSVRLTIDFSATDQHRGVAPPPVEKAVSEGARRISLPNPVSGSLLKKVDLTEAIALRQSHRVFLDEPLSLGEISFLLWATQGIRKKVNEAVAFRTVPSAGCRHAFETYLFAMKVSGLEPAIYRYLPLSHELLFVTRKEKLGFELAQAALGQAFVGNAAVTFVWTAIPYRMEWRYDRAAHKVIAIDAGHVCQNLYLACSSVDSGCCAVAAYDQEKLDTLLGVDGDDEFAIYLAALGKIRGVKRQVP